MTLHRWLPRHVSLNEGLVKEPVPRRAHQLVLSVAVLTLMHFLGSLRHGDAAPLCGEGQMDRKTTVVFSSQ
jgi:hypothetical protein